MSEGNDWALLNRGVRVSLECQHELAQHDLQMCVPANPHLELVRQDLVGSLDVFVELAHTLCPVDIVDGIARTRAPQVCRGFHAHMLQPSRIQQAERTRLQGDTFTSASNAGQGYDNASSACF